MRVDKLMLYHRGQAVHPFARRRLIAAVFSVIALVALVALSTPASVGRASSNDNLVSLGQALPSCISQAPVAYPTQDSQSSFTKEANEDPEDPPGDCTQSAYYSFGRCDQALTVILSNRSHPIPVVPFRLAVFSGRAPPTV